MQILTNLYQKMCKIKSILTCVCYFLAQEDVGVIRQVDPTAKEITYNPRYEEMFTPQVVQCGVF